MTPVRQATIAQQMCRALKWLPSHKQPLLNKCVILSNDSRQTRNHCSTNVSCSQMTPVRQGTIAQQMCRALKWLPSDKQPLHTKCVVLSNDSRQTSNHYSTNVSWFQMTSVRQATISQQMCRDFKWLPSDKQPLLDKCVVLSNDFRQTSNHYSTNVSCSQMTPVRQATITRQMCRALKWLPSDKQPLLSKCVVLSNDSRQTSNHYSTNVSWFQMTSVTNQTSNHYSTNVSCFQMTSVRQATITQQMCRAFKWLPSDKQPLLNKCVVLSNDSRQTSNPYSTNVSCSQMTSVRQETITRQMCRALKWLPSDKQPLLDKCVVLSNDSRQTSNHYSANASCSQMTPVRQATITQQMCRDFKWLPSDKQPLLNKCVVLSNDFRQTSNHYSTNVSCSQMTPVREATITRQTCRALNWLPSDK